MSLISSIRMAGNTLQANQIAMQVVGQNIANANTPGYIREEVIFKPATVQKMGDLPLGLGVDVVAIIQKVDAYLEERLRGVVSDRASTEMQESTFIELETLVNEMGDLDLSTSLNEFITSISEVLNQPESTTTRAQVVLHGQALLQNLQYVAGRVDESRTEVDSKVFAVADEINRRVEEIATLNVRIAESEGGGTSESDAVGLRDQRLIALEALAEIIDIRSVEQDDRSMVVYSGGEYLVFGGVSREVEAVRNVEDGRVSSSIRIKGIDAQLDASGGEYQGLLAARDDILGEFLDNLDTFAETLIFEFNRIYSSGQGLTGYEELTSDYQVDAADQALNAAGLDFTPTSGAFEVLVRSSDTGLTKTTEVTVDLNGTSNDTTLEDLVAQLDAIDGISAAVTFEGGLTISSDSAAVEFSFGDDSSGVLAALGVNTFFSGSSAQTIGINSAVAEDASKFAASRGGIGADTENAVDLANFTEIPLESADGRTLFALYEDIVGEMAQGSAIAQSLAESTRSFEETLRSQKLATSGVSLDEEAVDLIALQQSFLASSRFISTLNDLFTTLLNI